MLRQEPIDVGLERAGRVGASPSPGRSSAPVLADVGHQPSSVVPDDDVDEPAAAGHG